MSVINTNITSLIAQNNLGKSQNALSTAMERLSSGMRINSAKDDAAGQAIANRMSAQIGGLAQAQRNSNDGISMAQTAEGGLNQVNDNLQRIRELTVQAANGTNSASDLDSIQSEIDQRLSEIDRISRETDFNGEKVLASDQGLKIQVGANDGQAISINLKEITADTLGMNGFNVNGGGVTDNAQATVTNIQANGGTELNTNGGGEWGVDTVHVAATFEDLLANMQDGNTVAVSGADTYTYNEASGDFTFDNTAAGVSGAAAATTFVEEQGFVPTTGTISGVYEVSGNDPAAFEITSTGAITLDGQTAYINTTTGELTNNSGGASVAATAQTLVQQTAALGGQFTIDGTVYDGDGTADITFVDTATSLDVEAALNAAGDSTITLGDGFASKAVTYSGGNAASDDTWVDNSGELTDVQHFTTEYNINDETGEVTIHGVFDFQAATQGTVAGTKYDEAVGATVYVSGGVLTTEETTAGEATESPLAALDAALAQVDELRSDLGAIQNRFESAITNLSTNETNLSAARSRIEDADYAVEVANMTRAQILQQAGTSVLAQANQLPQNVLSLLG